MKKKLLLTTLVLLVPSFALAHVSVRPRESKPGAEERYTVRIPTEGAVATTHAVLDIPADVTVLEVLPAEGATFETAKQGDRITSITWRKAIPPKAAAEFVFRARNPAAGEIAWKAHQHFSDGTVADWVGVAGDKRPASVTKLSAQAAAAGPSGDAAAIETWLRGYDAAFNANDLDKLAAFYHPDVTIYEGNGINNGWIDYRDRHLGPKLMAFENLRFGHSNTKVACQGDDLRTSRRSTRLNPGVRERELDSRGLETLVLVTGAVGSWKTRHSHTWSPPARRPSGEQAS